MLFPEIIELIRNKEYSQANTELQALVKNGNEEDVAKAYYYLGYIHTCYDYQGRSNAQAKRFLRNNLNSVYPAVYAYVLFARYEQDKNIVVNYLYKGIQKFPDNPQLYLALLRYSQDKGEVIARIKDEEFTDPELLGRVISCLFASGRWEEIPQFTFRIENNNELEETETAYLNLIRGYALTFAQKPDYSQAIPVFEKVIAEDTDNRFAYAHYMGIIYACIQSDNLHKATEYFDKLPLTNAIHDLDDWPMMLGIEINFEPQYNTVFSAITNMYQTDPLRKSKAEVLRSLYRYYPSTMFDVCRYQKKDAAVLTRFLKNEFVPEVATALYCMRCHFNQFKEAYEVLWQMLNERVDLEEQYIDFTEITGYASNVDLQQIAEVTLEHLENDDFSEAVFLKAIFCELIGKLHKAEMFESVRKISQYFSIEQISNCECAFNCAFAYGKSDDARASAIYEHIIRREPRNSSATNNLGVQYEHKGELFKALEYYELALQLDPSEKIYQRNCQRMNEQITNQLNSEATKVAKAVSAKNFEHIGYTTELCQKIFTIADEDMRNIILRDLCECAIAVIAGQDKMATIMCGSIMEAVLMQKLQESGISKYDITEISLSKRAKSYPLTEMGLNELLYVADKENLLDKNSYRLGHYIRDYRNIVHPAKEKRFKDAITHNDVLTMWTVLKRLIDELYPKSNYL